MEKGQILEKLNNMFRKIQTDTRLADEDVHDIFELLKCEDTSVQNKATEVFCALLKSAYFCSDYLKELHEPLKSSILEAVLNTVDKRAVDYKRAAEFFLFYSKFGISDPNIIRQIRYKFMEDEAEKICFAALERCCPDVNEDWPYECFSIPTQKKIANIIRDNYKINWVHYDELMKYYS